MEEQDKEGLSMCEIQSWFEGKGIQLNSDWLSSLLSHLGRKATIKSVFEQFVFSRLEESYERPMKIPENASKIILTRRIVFQVLSVVNIARPIYEQMREELRTENNLTWFYGEDCEEHEVSNYEKEVKDRNDRQCAMITVTDGSTTLKGIDYGRVDGLTDEIPIGTKLLIVDKVTCRRSVMVLKAKNCIILGGAFESEGPEMSKVKSLSLLLSPSTKAKIEPYMSRMKKELDPTQRTISPFLRRIPPSLKDVPPPRPPPTSFPSLQSPSQLSYVRPVVSTNHPQSTISSSLQYLPPPPPSASLRPPPPLIPPLRGDGNHTKSSSTPHVIVEPTIKIEEIDPDASVIWMEKESLPLKKNRVNDSVSSAVVGEQRIRNGLPIIPIAGHIEMRMRESQVDASDENRLCLPVRPCVKLTPRTLEERIKASQTRGTNKELDRKGTTAASNAGWKDSSRSIASYFQTTKLGENRWNNKPENVELRNIEDTRYENEIKRKEMEEGIEIGRRKEEEARIMREEMERREREERMKKEEEERMRRIYYDEIRRDLDERKRREETQCEIRRQSYGSYGGSAPQVSVVVMSTPTPSSYITPPTGVATLPQSNEMLHLSHHQSSIPPIVRHPSSFNNDFLLGGGNDGPSMPMRMFGSPPRVDPSSNHDVIPFKKAKVENHKTTRESFGLEDFHTKCGFNEGQGSLGFVRHEENRIDGMHTIHDTHGGMLANGMIHKGMRNSYESHMQPLMSEPFSSMMQHQKNNNAHFSSHEQELHARYMGLNTVPLRDVMGNRKFWMMPKSFNVAPLYATIDRNLNIEQGLWDMKMRIVDESGETIMCQLDPRLLEELLGMTVVSARRLRDSNVTQFHKFKNRGSKMFKSMERMDLILNVEVTPEPKELPVITKIRTLPEVLGVV